MESDGLEGLNRKSLPIPIPSTVLPFLRGFFISAVDLSLFLAATPGTNSTFRMTEVVECPQLTLFLRPKPCQP